MAVVEFRLTSKAEVFGCTDMIEHRLAFDLPVPWIDKRFEIERFGAVNFLVGPNGSGKSRFAEALKGQLTGCRFLSTDRLQGMESHAGMGFLGDHFPTGIPKNWFSQVKAAGQNFGSGLDTIVLLEERLDLRIKIEATLSHLFNRQIVLEWDSGSIVATVTLGTGGSAYRLDREECHGIKELLILLTHLYNDEYPYLIIDEPELHLHPQYQAFFIQEVRKIAGNPETEPGKKAIFLITHSPFMLDIRSLDDLKSVISFSLKLAEPRHLTDIEDAAAARLATLIPRLNVHHKQLFFSDNPIFVEGIFDAQIVQMIQECRNVSIAGAGSCIIDAGGCEEVHRYLELCSKFGKEAHFLYDLDSLFTGNLRACLHGDGTVASFLGALGLGVDFGQYCGALDRALTRAIGDIRDIEKPSDSIHHLQETFKTLAGNGELVNEKLAKARVVILVQIARGRQSVSDAITEKNVLDIEGRLTQIVAALAQKNIALLPNGALENHLPSYEGDPFNIPDNAKRTAVESEVAILAEGMTQDDLERRYGALYTTIRSFPAQTTVDTDEILIKYLSNYVHEVQGLAVSQLSLNLEEIKRHLAQKTPGIERLFSLESFVREEGDQFNARITILESTGEQKRFVDISDQTNAGMRAFEIRTDDN